jgi:NAD(P)-dependent dehydrogenase (short-subunit alcohol dehydrogenase family)
MSPGQRRVLITGASSGIGRAIACELAADFHVIATARRIEPLADVPCDQRLQLDVADEESVRAAFAEAGEVHILVNNAGIGAGGPLELLPLEEVRRQFEVNVLGSIRTMQAALPQMRVRGTGHIINISSMAARIPWAFGGVYAATKSALESVTEALRLELPGEGIHFVLVEPGVIATPFGERFALHGLEHPAYAENATAWNNRFSGYVAPADDVALEVRKVIESRQPPLRVTVGQDAHELVALRRQLDDEAFDSALRFYYRVRS